MEEQYLKLVSDELKVSVMDIKSKCRDRELCEARQISSYVLHKYTKCSYWSIARLLNYVSHASPLRDVKQIPDLMEYDKVFADKVQPILLKAGELARDIRAFESNKKKQEEYDRIFAAFEKEEWYENLFYAGSLMLS